MITQNKLLAVILVAASTPFLTAEEASNGLRREVWTGIGGAGVWHLRKHEKFHQRAQFEEIIENAETPKNSGNRYGQRLRGYVVPKRSGDYTFWITSDDNSELWLSPNDSKFGKERISWIRGHGAGRRSDYAGKDQWKRFRSQKSVSVKLLAGKKYFIEALHKENVGKDHLAIGWSFGEDEDPKVISSEYLIPYTEDAEDRDLDDLPDAWEQSHNMSVSDNGRFKVDNGPLGDPDGDGWLSWEEYLNGTDPWKAESHQGKFLAEVWYNISGTSTEELFANNRFHLSPDERLLHAGCAVDESAGSNHYGMRLRGFVVPPEDGIYHFLISGDNNCELLLSKGESRFDLERVARVGGPVGSRKRTKKAEWGKYESQKSREIKLEAGKRYYLEVLHKDAWGRGHVSFCWIPPGAEGPQEIPASSIFSYQPSAEDPDDDGLPTEWEKENGMDPFSAKGGDGPTGDQDGDLIPNWCEYDFSTDPNEANDLTGAFAEEIWRGIEGHFVKDLTHAPEFLDKPTYQGLRLGRFSLAERGESYGIRLRAKVTAPKTGPYTFWISSDNHSELWISETDRRFDKNLVAWLKGSGAGTTGDFSERRQFGRYPSQKSNTVYLEEGESYFMEVLLKQGAFEDHVDVAWLVPGEEKRHLMPADVLRSHIHDKNDLDNDYLPDDWELKHNLSAEDNGSLAGFTEGEFGDFDGDRLTNWQEYRLGTDPSSSDTDGDGVDDYTEVNDYRSDPTVQDVFPPSVYRQVEVTEPSERVGEWEEDRGLLSVDSRGELTYPIELSEAGIYFAELVSEVVSEQEHEMPVRFLINGDLVAQRGIVGSSREIQTTSVRLPWLERGSHKLTIDSDNVRSGARLRVVSLRLLKPEGLDRNRNGIADWMENILDSENTISSPSFSYISPACLEGTSSWLASTSFTVGSARSAGVNEGINNGWFVNVPLEEEGQTRFSFSFEGGLVTSGLAVEWRATNLLLQEEAIHLRVGDALRLTGFSGDEALSSGDVKIFVDRKQAYKGAADEPHVHRFDSAGTVTLRIQVKEGKGRTLSNEVTVYVYEADFGEPFYVVSGQNLLWELPKVDLSLILESDQSLRLEEVWDAESNRSALVGFPEVGQYEKGVLARLPRQGAIVARGTVNGFILAQASLADDTEVLEVLGDGTRVIRAGYVLDGPVPADFSIFLSIWVPDTVFEDGQSTRILTAADFDENGRASLLFIKAPGDESNAICHVFEARDGETQLNR